MGRPISKSESKWWDFISPFYKRHHRNKPGYGKWVKRLINRAKRREGKRRANES